MARNEGVGQFTNLGVGLGTMAGIGGVVAGTLNSAMNDAFKQTDATTATGKCTKCGATLPELAKFCFECGEKIEHPIPENMMRCPQCGNIVANGKFCSECGHKFIAICPDCGKEITDGAKFCFECGKKL